MKRLASALVVALASSLCIAVAAPAAWCAGDEPTAALVIERGDGGEASRLCVEIPDDGTSGIGLIKLAADQYGLTYRLGYGDQAVCMLDGVGSQEGECFSERPYFWGYWRWDGSDWTWSSSGAGSTVVEDGDVEGWSWDSGDSPESHDAPPPTTYASVCGEDEPAKTKAEAKPEREDRAKAEDQEDAVAQAPEYEDDETESEKAGSNAGAKKVKATPIDPGGSARPDNPTPEDTGEPGLQIDPARPVGDVGDDDEGAPVGAVVALAVTIVLLVAGGLILRRKKAV